MIDYQSLGYSNFQTHPDIDLLIIINPIPNIKPHPPRKPWVGRGFPPRWNHRYWDTVTPLRQDALQRAQLAEAEICQSIGLLIYLLLICLHMNVFTCIYLFICLFMFLGCADLSRSEGGT